jgi:UDP-N-acetylglucosamine 1-carboxyvinyltransferase
MALMSVAEGTGIMSETVFENRFKHVDELARMGADIRVEGRAAVIKGVRSLSGANVRASDLRAGAALVAAGLAAEGITEIEDIHYIERGYETLDHRLRGIGADIVRI